MIQKVPISEVASVNPRLPKDADPSQRVSFLSMASVSESGEILGQESRILEDTRKGFTYFERGDVILAKITPCFENGKAALLDSLETRIGFGSTEFHVLRPDPARLDAKYLFYLVWSDYFRFHGQNSMQGAAGQKRVSATFLKDFVIPLPHLSEQKRIASMLEKVDALRRKRQQAIELADQFLRSVFLEMFGDPVSNPKGWKLGTFEDYCKINPKNPVLSDDTEVSFVPMRCVSESSHLLDLTETRLYAQVKRGFTGFSEGDVIFAKITPCMENGKSGIASNLKNRTGYGSTEFHVLRPREPEFAPFLYSLVHLDVFRAKAASSFSGAAGHKRVPREFLEAFPLYKLPRKAIQDFATIFHIVKSSQGKAVLGARYFDELFGSLVQRVFDNQL